MAGIALYLRLSIADGDLGKDKKEESNSIENQRLLIKSFLKDRDDIDGEIVEYVDDGYSGTNFDRPAFRRMIEDAKKKKISTILVKDLSRLGRDYIGVGDYMEQIFPLLGIRLIAVTSSYDSNDYIGKTIGLEVSINNLVNALYSRDLSKKYRSAIKAKWEQGISTYGRLPFGYMKDPNDHSKWILDPESSHYVRTMFDLAIHGHSTTDIARYLNEHKIPTLGRYRELHEENYKQYKIVKDKEWMWDNATVWRILQNYCYTGTLIHGKSRLMTVGGRTARSVPKGEQFITPKAHPAIVTESEWRRAQETIIPNSKRYVKRKRVNEYPLLGKVRCGTCGLTMKVDHEDQFTKLYCIHSRATGGSTSCYSENYNGNQVERTVLKALKTELSLFLQLCESLTENRKKQEADMPELKKIERDIEALKTRRIHLYEQYADGRMNRDSYLQKKQELTDKLQQSEQKRQVILDLLNSTNETLLNVKTITDQIPLVAQSDLLTIEMAERFIENVYLYDPDHMEIHFTFSDLLKRATEECVRGGEDESKTQILCSDRDSVAL